MQLSAGPFQRIISLRMTEDMLEQLRAAQEQDGHGNGNGCAWSVELSGEKRGNFLRQHSSPLGGSSTNSPLVSFELNNEPERSIVAIYRSSRSSINTDDRNDNDTSSSLEEHDQEQLERENDSSSLYLCGRVSQKLSLIPSSSMSSSKIRKLTEAAEQEKKTRTTQRIDSHSALESMKKAKNSSSKLRHTNSTSNLFKVKHTSSSHASARPGGAHANNTTASSSSSTASPNMFRVNSSSNDLNNLAARDTSIGPTATRERSHSASSGGIRPRVRLVKILSLKPQSLEFLSKILSLSPAATKKELEEIAKMHTNSQSYHLRPEIYKEVRPFDWNYTFQEQETVIANAMAAFAQIKLPDDAPERKYFVNPSIINTATSSTKPSVTLDRHNSPAHNSNSSSSPSLNKRGVSPAIDDRPDKKIKTHSNGGTSSSSLKPSPSSSNLNNTSSSSKKKSSSLSNNSSSSKTKKSRAESVPLEFRNHSLGVPAAQTDTTRGGLGPLPSKTSSSSAAAAASSNTNLPKSSSAGSLLLHQLNPSTKGPSSSYATLAASAAAAAVTMRSHDFELEEIQEPEALAPAEVSAMDARSRSKLCDIKLHQQDLLYKKINDIVGILRPFQHRAKTLATTNTTLLSSSSSSNSTLVCDVQAAISLSDLIRNEQIILMISERGLEWYLEALVGRYNALQQQINMLQ